MPKPSPDAILLIGGPFHNRYAPATADFSEGVAIKIPHTRNYALYSWSDSDRTYVWDGTVKDPELLPDPEEVPPPPKPWKRFRGATGKQLG